MKLENEEGGKASFLECESREVSAPFPQEQQGLPSPGRLQYLWGLGPACWHGSLSF